MSRKTYLYVFTACVIIGSFLFSCGKKDDSGSSGEESDKGQTQGTLAIGAASIDDVNASSALIIAAPPAVVGKGLETTAAEAGTVAVDPGLVQTKRKKSAEACYLRNRLKEELLQLKEASLALCHVEAESVGAGFGKKFKITDEESGDSYQFWADNSKYDGGKGSLTIHICENELPWLKLTVTGAKDGASKGRFKFVEDEDGEFWSSEGFFDNKFTNPHRVQIASSQYSYVDDGEGNNEEFLERFAMSFSDKGVSHVRMSSEGFVAEEDGFSEAYLEVAAARFGQRLGSIVFASNYDNTDGDSGTDGYRSFFDGKGFYVDPTGIPAFESGSRLYAAVKDMPKPLDRTFRVAEFDPAKGDWDCAGTEELPEVADELVARQDAKFASCEALEDEYAAEADALDAAAESCSDDASYEYGGSEEVDLATLDPEFSEEDILIEDEEAADPAPDPVE